MPIFRGDTITDFSFQTDTIVVRSTSADGGVWRTTDVLATASGGTVGTHEVGHLLGLPPTSTAIDPDPDVGFMLPALGGAALDPF